MKRRESWIIGLDFDGTVCENSFPEIGRPVPWAREVLKELVVNGHRIVLWTVRSGPPLDWAVSYMMNIGVPIWGINENPEQHEFSQSPEAHCHVYIDDKALGVPLKTFRDRDPYVDWVLVRRRLIDTGLIRDPQHYTAPAELHQKMIEENFGS